MEFPKRTNEHIKESAGWRILQSKAPTNWIIRELTERDYGIDSYIELVSPNSSISGDLCSIQLKSRREIPWKQSNKEGAKRARSPGIKKSTVNYWMNLPVPVFLISVDLSTNRVYFAPVKEQIRTQYTKYRNEKRKSLSFELDSNFELGTQLGDALFTAFYFKEKTFNQFSGYLRGLLIHWQQYYEFIVYNQDPDAFLEVEEERQLVMIHIYRSCRFICGFLGIEWNVMDLSEAYRKDRETWKNSYYSLHELTFSKLLKELEPIFLKTIDKAKMLIVEKQKDYWMKTDWILFRTCSNLNIQHLKRELRGASGN